MLLPLFELLYVVRSSHSESTWMGQFTHCSQLEYTGETPSSIVIIIIIIIIIINERH